MGNKKKDNYNPYNDVNCLQAVSYCFKHKIRIYPVPKNRYEYYLYIDNKGALTISTKTYKLSEWSDKVFELYLFYYYRNNPSVKLAD